MLLKTRRKQQQLIEMYIFVYTQSTDPSRIDDSDGFVEDAWSGGRILSRTPSIDGSGGVTCESTRAVQT